MRNEEQYICKCVFCLKLNKQRDNTLPFVCPIYSPENIPCIMIKSECVLDDDKLDELTTFVAKFNNCNKDIKKARIPMNCEYMDKEKIEYFLEGYDNLDLKII